VWSAVDCIVRAQTIVRLPVTGTFGDNPKRVWFVDRGFVKCNKLNLLATDPLLFKSSVPIVSVFNAAHAKRVIRKGDILGYLEEPGKFFNLPRTTADAEKMYKHTTKTANFV
jgi:hypothetical protein